MKTFFTLGLSLFISFSGMASTQPKSNEPVNAQVKTDPSEYLDLNSPTRLPEINHNVDTIKSVDGIDPTKSSSKKKTQSSSSKKKASPLGNNPPTPIDNDSSL